MSTLTRESGTMDNFTAIQIDSFGKFESNHTDAYSTHLHYPDTISPMYRIIVKTKEDGHRIKREFTTEEEAREYLDNEQW